MNTIPKKPNVAIILPSYNMHGAVVELKSQIERLVKWPYSLILVENGSESIELPHIYDVILSQNVNTTGGFMAGINHALWLEATGQIPYIEAVWLMTTSATGFPELDPLTPMMEFMAHTSRVACVTPGWIGEFTSPVHKALRHRGTGEIRRTWIGGLNSVWDRRFLEYYRWLPIELPHSWGIDYQLSLRARQRMYSLWVDDRSGIKIEENIGHRLEKMGEPVESRQARARAEMENYMTKRYGPDWLDHVTNDCTNPEWLE